MQRSRSVRRGEGGEEGSVAADPTAGGNRKGRTCSSELEPASASGPPRLFDPWPLEVPLNHMGDEMGCFALVIHDEFNDRTAKLKVRGRLSNQTASCPSR